MKNLKKIFKGLIPVLLIMQTITAVAQDKVRISGRVIDDANGQTLPGVNIRVKDRVVGTITNAQGDFNLTVNQAAPITLIFSYVGYTPQELEITQLPLLM